jgi:hypothetical protein
MDKDIKMKVYDAPFWGQSEIRKMGCVLLGGREALITLSNDGHAYVRLDGFETHPIF